MHLHPLVSASAAAAVDTAAGDGQDDDATHRAHPDDQRLKVHCNWQDTMLITL